jgi:2-polyprenyl-6-methoxyphenol hydroxylase-like FAD-dependent oxidoreductase
LYGQEVQPIDFDSTAVLLSTGQVGPVALVRVAQCTNNQNDGSDRRQNPTTVTATDSDDDASLSPAEMVCDTDVTYVATPLLVAADGSGRTMATAIVALEQARFLAKTKTPWTRYWSARRSALSIHRYPDDNQRIYKTIPLRLPVANGWRGDLNYSARTKRVNFDALPANTKGDYCGVLLLKSNDPLARANTDPTELRALLNDALPQFSALLDDETVAAVARKPVSYLPAFRYVSRLHHRATTVLLGDAAHQVKPYFGLGCNSALEDVVVLADCLSEHTSATDLPQAVTAYSRRRSTDAKVLVQISRDLDRPGPLGVIMFIVPLIMDAMFAKCNKVWPGLFQPNVITMLQDERYTFRRLARRKRWDRTVQVSILGLMAWGLALAARLAVQGTASLFKTRPRNVWSGLVLLNTIALMARSLPMLVRRQKTATTNQ